MQKESLMPILYGNVLVGIMDNDLYQKFINHILYGEKAIVSF